MLKTLDQKLEPVYQVFRQVDQKLREQPSEVRLITAIISLIVNLLVPVVYLIAHKPKMATWMSGFIVLQFFMWGAWFFGSGIIGVLANAAVGILSIIWLAFWFHAIYLFITKIIPEWKQQREQEARDEEERRKFTGVRIGYDDEQ